MNPRELKLHDELETAIHLDLKSIDAKIAELKAAKLELKKLRSEAIRWGRKAYLASFRKGGRAEEAANRAAIECHAVEDRVRRLGCSETYYVMSCRHPDLWMRWN